MSTPPAAILLASGQIWKSRLKSGILNTGADTSASLIFANAFSQSFDHLNPRSFFVNSSNGAAAEEDHLGQGAEKKADETEMSDEPFAWNLITWMIPCSELLERVAQDLPITITRFHA